MSSVNHTAPGAPSAFYRRHWSLTLWLTLCNSISAFLLISLIAAFLYFGLAAQLKEQNHIFLLDEVETVENLIRVQESVAPVVAEASRGHASSVRYVKHYIRVLEPNGAVILETPGMRELLPAHVFQAPATSGDPGVDRTRYTADGRVMLYTSYLVKLTKSGRQRIVQVALDVTNVEEILVGYRQKIYLALSIGFLLCIAVSFAIARRGTRPLREMTDIVRRITATNLEERISGKGWPRELNNLADAMNLMLNRLEDSFTRLYNSATNLSHKMRTPLTILKGEAEVALSRDRSNEELQDVIASSLEEVTRLSRLGESILFLANAEMGKFRMERSLIDCREEVEQVIEYYWPFAEDRGITFTCEGSALLMADAALFRKTVAALISNGLTYNPHGGTVGLALRQKDELSGEISITDSGCGIPPGEVVKIFDRFYRVYATRHMDPHGTGLGLPIAKAIMDLHEGSIAVESVHGKGTTVTLSFPALSAAPNSCC